ncbi:uncharacterized protein LOC115890898 [Sitophilus oryzae]|uniref:Uncharacterized protein LOC115890898 n=1 Tax=Sitophilus oryzae TaxID=7048 RepID=A0A6J2YUZ9_SITOR|nr:uncharacterized protein LOC115890898 [Sitophilus oryzae]XP_030767110.1 uncharacterized protein LOC115890898 [Sitophilus oryzae]XP_030767111.1 uncharacterized protein LOC115890898 [Sitophilus oryzae]
MAPIDYSIKDIDKIIDVDGDIKNVEVTRLTAPGENYLSLVLRVDIEAEKDGHRKIVKAVAKRLPLGKNTMGGEMHSFAMNNEIKFYSEIIPILTKFSSEYGIDSRQLYAKFLGSRLSLDPTKTEADEESVLLVENLIPQGYQNEDRFIGFDLITAKGILKKLALFHAIPIALRSKDPEQYKIVKEFLDTPHPHPPKGPPGEDNKNGPPEGHEGPDKLLLKAIQNIPECSPFVARLEPLLNKPMGPPGSQPGVEPWATISHGDFWVNNVMIKPQPGKEPLVKLVDFQGCRYQSFARDVVFFFLTSLRNDVHKEHFDDLLRCYYDEFTKLLKPFDLDLELTYDEYLKELETAAKDGETKHAIFFSNIVFGEKNSSVDVAVEDVDFFAMISKKIENMNEFQRAKLILIVSEVCERDWV